MNKDIKEGYIIGAGISGLIAAYELEQEGFQPTIIEKSDKVGGRVKTLHENGLQLDLGFQVLLSAYPLAKKYLDMEALELKKLESGAMIYSNGKTYRIGDPSRNLSLLFPSLFANIGSMGDKFKILKLNRKLKKKILEEIFNSPETTTLKYLKAFGFTDKIISSFFKPFFTGIFLEPDLHTSSRMFEFIYKMFGEGYATIPKNGIGAISDQLKSKLKHTKFIFNCEVEEVTNDQITLNSGEKKSHQGVIVTNNASKLIPNLKDQTVNWKSCSCLYFEVNQTNIPKNSIALVADEGMYSNNLYAYRDEASKKLILSVTTLKHDDLPKQKLLDIITAEVKQYTGAKEINHIHSYSINYALPDIQNLRMSAPTSESQLLDNIFLAGDSLLNGSLNAAMESGRLASKSLAQKKKGTMPS